MEGIQPQRDATSIMREEMRRLRRLVGNCTLPVTLLDFGSGLGRWARAGVLEGFCVTAYEPSEERSSKADTPFEQVHAFEELGDRKFSAIQLEQVLEHVPDPFKTLTQLRGHCNSCTVIRITVPNILRDPDGLKIWSTWPFDGRAVHLLSPFEHLHAFTPSSLDQLLMRAGYRNINYLNEINNASINFIRRYIGKIRPTLNSTLRYVQLSHDYTEN